MEKTPKLHRKSLSLGTRLRNRSSASPGNRIQTPSSPSTLECDLNCTPPQRKFIFNPPYSPTNDLNFSPGSRLSQSSINSPEVTWRWTQDDPVCDKTPVSSILENSTPNRERRKKRLNERREEVRKVELEKIKANRTKRDIARQQQCEQMELLIAEKSNKAHTKNEDSPSVSKEQSLSNSSGYGSNNNINNVADFLNDSEADDLLLEATQKVEQNNKYCTKELEQSFLECDEKDKRSVSEYLHDSLDDWFASLDSDLLSAQPKKPRTSLQRYKSMPAESPVAARKIDNSKIKRYPSSSTLPAK